MSRAVSEDGGVMCELATKRACGGLLQFKARGDFRIKVIFAGSVLLYRVTLKSRARGQFLPLFWPLAYPGVSCYDSFREPR